MPIKREEFKRNKTGDPNDKTKYKGFSIDLFNNISAKASFNYRIIVVESTVGIGKNDPVHGWDGIINELIKGNAEFAITDIVINEERKKVIDFSVSFKTLGKLYYLFLFS